MLKLSRKENEEKITKYRNVLDELKKDVLASSGTELNKGFVETYFRKKLGSDYENALSELDKRGDIEYSKEKDKTRIN